MAMTSRSSQASSVGAKTVKTWFVKASMVALTPLTTSQKVLNSSSSQTRSAVKKIDRRDGHGNQKDKKKNTPKIVKYAMSLFRHYSPIVVQLSADTAPGDEKKAKNKARVKCLYMEKLMFVLISMVHFCCVVVV